MPTHPFIFDGHLDLAMNALAYNREQTWELAELRAYESDLPESDGRGMAMVTLPEMRKGGVRGCTATIFTRCQPGAAAKKCFRRSDSDSASPSITAAQAWAQLRYYQQLETRGEIRIVKKGEGRGVKSEAERAIDCVLLIECADFMTGPEDVREWHAAGVRAIGLTHIPPGRCGAGNGQDGPLTELGVSLLKAMGELGMVLDVSHLADTAMAQAFDRFGGKVLASHSNARALVPGMRQITDGQIREIVKRDGVAGVVLHGPMLVGGLTPGSYRREMVTLADVARHIDHICQLAGDARHVGIGSDLDGGFGREYVPVGIESIADLARIGAALAGMGYGDEDVAAVMGGNWRRFWA